MSNDEFSGIFDDLTPEDFNVETSAIDESFRENKGVAAFNSFVDEQLRALRLTYVAASGWVQPIAILASPLKQRTFSPDDDETLGEYTARLHREAKEMGATWVFISRKTLVGVKKFAADDVIPDVDDLDEISEGIASGRLSTGVVWYAERREGDERHRRHGMMVEDAPNRLGPPVEGDEKQALPLFDKILA